MNISITPELEKFVHAKVESGMYGSASEVMRAALRLLEEHDEVQKRRIAVMDALIQEGIDSGEKGGWLTPEQVEAQMDALFAELKRKHV